MNSNTELDLIPIEQAKINLEEAANKLFLGPQAELMEKIDSFNQTYGRNIGDVIQITKKYGFKRGTYDRIKKAYNNHVLMYNLAPKSMHQLRTRIANNRWKDRHFWSTATTISNMMYRLRHSAFGWQDNVKVVEDFWKKLIVRIPSTIETLKDSFPKDVVSISLDNNCLRDEVLWRNMNVYIDVFMSDINMNVFYQDELIADYLWGNMALRWKLPMWPYLNNWCEGGLQSNSNRCFNPIVKLYPRYKENHHPYIGRTSYNMHGDGYQGHVCTGDMQYPIGSSVWQLNLEALLTNARLWLSRYHIPNTNPLNRINKCYYGLPEKADVKLWKHRDSDPANEINRCQWPATYGRILNNHENEEFENPCDECQFKDEYVYTISNHLIPEDAFHPQQEVIEHTGCKYAIVDYTGPTTDEEAIIEACILHIMTCSYMRINPEFSDLDYRLSDEVRFPLDAHLDKIYEILPDFNLEAEFYRELIHWDGQGSEDLLDTVFNARIWHNLMSEFFNVLDINEDSAEAEDLSRDMEHDSIEDIREEIERIRMRHSQSNVLAHNIPISLEDNLTVEERTIRWATQNGSALNI